MKHPAKAVCCFARSSKKQLKNFLHSKKLDVGRSTAAGDDWLSLLF
jgi:hypothetical protein